MKINAYILAADPAWIETSVLSYYPIVQKIIVTYDRASSGWTGTPIAVEECLSRLQAIDTERKLVLLSGDFARLDYAPMENETHQRQMALDAASQDADWVVQLDTDEVLADSEIFLQRLHEAQSLECRAMDFPARWLYRQLGGDRYLEACRSLWRVSGGFPGPVAVAAGTHLKHARQTDAKLYRVDFARRNTDPWHPRDAVVHRTVGQDQGIYHFSMIRSEDAFHRKTAAFGHARDLNWEREFNHWLWCGRHPYRTSIASFFRRHRGVKLYHPPLRLTHIRLPAHLSKLNDSDGGCITSISSLRA